MTKLYIGLHAKCPLFLLDFNEILTFLTNFLKVFKYQISWKSDEWEPSSMRKEGRTDGQTRITKLKFAFRNFANAP